MYQVDHGALFTGDEAVINQLALAPSTRENSNGGTVQTSTDSTIEYLDHFFHSLSLGHGCMWSVERQFEEDLSLVLLVDKSVVAGDQLPFP